MSKEMKTAILDQNRNYKANQPHKITIQTSTKVESPSIDRNSPTVPLINFSSQSLTPNNTKSLAHCPRPRAANKGQICPRMLRYPSCLFQRIYGMECPYSHSIEECR